MRVEDIYLRLFSFSAYTNAGKALIETVMWRLILVVLVLLLTACSGAGTEPNREIAQRAIALQTRQLQQQLQQEVSELNISQVEITQKQPLIIDKLAGYRIQGTYDFTIKRKLRRGNLPASRFASKLPKQRLSKQKNPFDIYLQRQKEGKTWRLALPKRAKNGVVTWLTYAID